MKTLRQFISERLLLENPAAGKNTESWPPKKTIKVYKIFNIKQKQKGKIFPMFIGKNKETQIGVWLEGEKIPTKGFQDRPGWHSGILKPFAPHLMKKDGTMPQTRVWAEVLIPDDVNWQKVANKTAKGDIRGEVPYGGHYRWKRPANQGGVWMIAGAVKVNKILTPKEVEKLGGLKVKQAYPEGVPEKLDPWFK